MAQVMTLLSFPALLFSQERVMPFGIPIYLTEAVTVSSVFFLAVAVIKGEIRMRSVPAFIIIGFLLMCIGMVVSSGVTDGFDQEELGAIKSWLFFPSVASFVLYQSFQQRKTVLPVAVTWFCSVLAFSFATVLPGFASLETYDGRLTSIFPSPNHMALYLVPGFLSGLHVLCLVTRTHMRMAVVFGLGIVLGALWRTESLGGLIAVSTGCVVYGITLLRGHRAAAGLLWSSVMIVVSVCAFLVFTGTWERFSGGEIRSPLASRVMIWNVATSMIRQDPISGIGPRRFQERYLLMQPEFPPYLEWAVPHPHNVPLAMWLSGGVSMFAGWLILMGGAFVFALSSVRSGNIVSGGWMLSLLSAWAVHGLVEETYFRNDLALATWLVIAIVVVISEESRCQVVRRMR